MRYLMLVYRDERRWAETPAAEKEKLWVDCHTYGEEITRSGHLLAGAPLQPAATATTLRLHGGKLTMIDGPFAETKEVLAGYHLVECKDLDEAIAIGSRFPGLQVGSALEIRPVLQR
ncbi:MAG TPA: YciI family protein [Candidatus Synoicihabitans sp.]|nr:YciI family protein [Candidatus Synoicihabitans sp.]